jgi:hypothetical protein
MQKSNYAMVHKEGTKIHRESFVALKIIHTGWCVLKIGKIKKIKSGMKAVCIHQL